MKSGHMRSVSVLIWRPILLALPGSPTRTEPGSNAETRHTERPHRSAAQNDSHAGPSDHPEPDIWACGDRGHDGRRRSDESCRSTPTVPMTAPSLGGCRPPSRSLGPLPALNKYGVKHIRWSGVVVEVVYHPYFLEWFELAVHGRELGDPESHPVVTSQLGLRALRRTPPTGVTPYAEGPPVIRILYGFVAPAARACERCCSSEGTRPTSATGGIRPTSPKPSGDSRYPQHNRAGGS